MQINLFRSHGPNGHRPPMLRIVQAALLAAVTISPDAYAQEASRTHAVTAASRAISPHLDPAHDSALWQGVDSITDLRQRDPVEGAPASERTVTRIIRAPDGLLVRIDAYDRDVAGIRAAQLRRDSQISTDDNVILIIDSFHDHRTAFLFGTNPNGVMWDAQMSGGSDLDLDWNGVWDVATSRNASEWVAEFWIPFRTLRFNADSDAVFGFNVRRVIRRRNEESLWTGWRRTEGMSQLQVEGDLRGLGSLTRGRNLEVKPFVLSEAVEPSFNSAGDRVSGKAFIGKVGADAKIGVTPSLTADLTVNTDFAQVEADQQVINLTRFPLFFPEKRDFFLESSGIFEFGNPETAQLFYSRRIGLDNGTAVPILGGARITGREGAWTIGALYTRTGGADQANDGVVRVRRDVAGRGYVGAMITDRLAGGSGGNQSGGGLDGSVPLIARGQNVVLNGWVGATRDPGISGMPTAWSASVDYPNDLVNGFIAVSRVATGFSPSLGFVPRDGIVGSSGVFDYQPRPSWRGIRQLGFRFVPGWQIVSGEGRSLLDARHWQSGFLVWHPLAVTLQSGDAITLGVQRWQDHPDTPFEIANGVTIDPRVYWFTRGTVAVSTASHRWLSGSASLTFGKYYDGASEALNGAVVIHGAGHLQLTQSLAETRAHLSKGSFEAIVASTRFEYALTTRANILGFVQVNNQSHRADFNLRYHWMPGAGDDVYVVWNSGYPTGQGSHNPLTSLETAQRPLDGAFAIKVTHRIAM